MSPGPGIRPEPPTREVARPSVAFLAVTGAFLAVTIAESLLPPLYPVLAQELDLGLATAGLAFGLLTGSIAVGNIGGGYLLARRGPRIGVLTSVGLAGAGSVTAALATGRTWLLGAQVLIGLGAGVFFPPGINAAGRLVPRHRRGLAMGLFGLAFSVGLALAAGLAALGGSVSWRAAFWVAAASCLVAGGVTVSVELPLRVLTAPGGYRRRLREALGVAAVVGGIGSASQYGTVSFLPVFAVSVWDVSPAYAAAILGVGRVLSAPGKVIVGWTADRWGPSTTVRLVAGMLLLTGLAWVLLPLGTVALAAAVLFTAGVSLLFPIANLLAVEGFGDRGPLLGTFRAAQIGVGAAAAAVIGPAADAFGLRVVLGTSATLLPIMLFAARARSVGATGPVDAVP